MVVQKKTGSGHFKAFPLQKYKTCNILYERETLVAKSFTFLGLLSTICSCWIVWDSNLIAGVELSRDLTRAHHFSKWRTSSVVHARDIHCHLCVYWFVLKGCFINIYFIFGWLQNILWYFFDTKLWYTFFF